MGFTHAARMSEEVGQWWGWGFFFWRLANALKEFHGE